MVSVPFQNHVSHACGSAKFADDYNGLLNNHNELVNNYNVLLDRNNELIDEYNEPLGSAKRIRDDLEEAENVTRNLKSCIAFASTLAEAQDCYY